MRALLAFTTYFILTLASAQSYAREYVVEAIIFSNEIDANQPVNEYWDAQEPRIIRAQNKIQKGLASAVTLEPENLQPLEVLAEAQKRLVQSPKHRVLSALSWVQSEADYSNSPLVDAGDGLVLSGTLRIYAPSLLFAELNLRYAPGDALSIPDPELPQFFIDENRKIKLKEIHYFDQPRFGVILSVRRQEEPAQ